jgi:hypothetical protein
MHTSTTALSSYLERVHKILKETDPKTACTAHPTLMAKWLKNQPRQEEQLSFEDALLD